MIQSMGYIYIYISLISHEKLVVLDIFAMENGYGKWMVDFMFG